ncbi:MAG: MarR family winged helix-turn-helix transcriptional regulator [Streptosporangiaceae bacterium]
MPADQSPDRDRLTRLIEEHLRSYGTESSRVADVFAQQHGMHSTDLQALVLIMSAERQGAPATPKLLREHLNLTSGAVTGVVDRLVRAGHVRRELNAADRRQSHLFAAVPALQVARAFFGPLGARTEELLARRSVGELAVIEAFLREMVAVTTGYRSELGLGAGPEPRTGLAPDGTRPAAPAPDRLP